MKSLKLYLRGMMLLSIIFILAILPVSTALADSEGPNNPGAGFNVAGIGSEPWINPDEIITPGPPYTSVTLYQGHRYSNYLQGIQYGFDIPADATITGIEVSINRMSDSQNPNIADNVVSLVKAGSIEGENKASPDQWPTTFVTATYGGPLDLWGTEWTPSDINSPGFGVVLAAYRDNNGNNSREALVDIIQVKIFYEFTMLTTLECGDGTPIMYGESVTCVATVTHLGGDLTPTGTVDWTTNGTGTFDPNPCTLSGAGGIATCTSMYTPRSVGTGIHLITASYSGDNYFSPSQVSQEVSVETRPVTVTADPQNKVYGELDPEFTYQITEGSLVFGDTFTGTLTRVPGEDTGTYAILQGTLALPDSYDLTYIGDFITINKADPTCEITPYDVPYDGTNHTATGICTGIFDEELSGLDLTGTTHSNVGTYLGDPWTFTDETGNYNDASGTVDNEIRLRAITVTADAKSKIVGQRDPELTYQITAGSLLVGDTFSGALTREPGQVAGTYAILQGTLSLPTYYEITFISVDFTIFGTVYLFPLIIK